MFKFKVNRRSLELIEVEELVSGTIDDYEVEFDFDECWSDWTPHAVFTNTWSHITKEQLLEDNKCVIPWEVLDPGTLLIGIYGVKDSKFRPTIYSEKLCIYQGVETGDFSKEPTPETYQQLVNYVSHAMIEGASMDEDYNLIIHTKSGDEYSAGPIPKGEDGLTPFIGEDYNWWIGDTNTGVKAEAIDGKDFKYEDMTEEEKLDLVSHVSIPQSDWYQEDDSQVDYIKNKPIEKGEGEHSIQTIDSHAISANSLALGVNSIAGCRGYHYQAIDFINKKIYLTTETDIPTIVPVVIEEGADASSYIIDDFEIPAYQSGNEIVVFDYIFHYFCGTIASIEKNIITLDDNGFNYNSFGEAAAPLSIEDYSLFVPAQPEIGIVNLSWGGIALGQNCKASGENAVAEGYGAQAAGKRSHAEGLNTKTGIHAHAEGQNTRATGYAAHAEGLNTVASGTYTHAEGNKTQAIGEYAHSEGSETVSSAQASHAEGYMTQAIGAHSHSEGTHTKAEGVDSHAEGSNSNAIGESSHAEGYKTTARGLRSHAEGYETSALSTGSHSEGTVTIAEGSSAHAEGYNSKATAQAAHSEGMSTIASGVNSHAEGNETESTADSSHAEGVKTHATARDAHAEGYSTTASEVDSHAEGNSTVASGKQSHAEGQTTIASGSQSHAEGYNTQALGQASHAEGKNTVAKSQMAHAEGLDTQANGSFSHAEGQETIANAARSHAEGYKTNARADGSHAEGLGTYIQPGSNYQHVQGKYNKVMSGEYAHVVGNGTEGARSNAHTLDWSGNAWFAGDVTVGENNEKLATENVVDSKIADMVDSAPETLNTLNELAAALGDDPNFATTVATQLGNKVDKVEGKGLSTNDFTDEYKRIVKDNRHDADALIEAVTTLEENLDNKVDKEEGKGLSTNDFTDQYKNQIEDNAYYVGRVSAVADENYYHIGNMSDLLTENTNTLVDAINEIYGGIYQTPIIEIPTTLAGNSQYNFGTVETLSLAFPTTASDGNVIYLTFYSGETATTLSIDTTNTSDIEVVPEANTGYEIFGKYNGSIWIINYSEYTVSEG